MYQPYCIDIYQGDNVIDSPGPLGGFSQVKAQGIAFLDHKASEGVSEQDSRVAARYTAWMNGGTITVTDVDGTTLKLAPRFGFYHFNGTGSAAAEAANFIAAVKPIFNKGDDLYDPDQPRVPAGNAAEPRGDGRRRFALGPQLPQQRNIVVGPFGRHGNGSPML